MSVCKEGATWKLRGGGNRGDGGDEGGVGK